MGERNFLQEVSLPHAPSFQEHKIKEDKMNEEVLAWYADLRRFGGCKHAGFGIGFERLVMYLTGIQNIRDVLPFPRTPKNLNF